MKGLHVFREFDGFYDSVIGFEDFNGGLFKGLPRVVRAKVVQRPYVCGSLPISCESIEEGDCGFGFSVAALRVVALCDERASFLAVVVGPKVVVRERVTTAVGLVRVVPSVVNDLPCLSLVCVCDYPLESFFAGLESDVNPVRG